MIELEFLGTGTSTGVPQIGCNCKVCQSTDPKDNRLRTSVIVRTTNLNILIDCGPDFREQILRASSNNLDALLVTHSHYDHVGGIDDLRPYCKYGSFPIYCQKDVIDDLHSRIPYCFKEKLYPGVPKLELIEIDLNPFKIGDLTIKPLRVYHYKLPILGYMIGNLAYITDAKTIPEETIEQLKGIDTLIINALRIEPHISHMSLAECLDKIKEISPHRAYLIHLSHDMGLHEEVTKLLPENVEIAYDGEVITIE